MQRASDQKIYDGNVGQRWPHGCGPLDVSATSPVWVPMHRRGGRGNLVQSERIDGAATTSRAPTLGYGLDDVHFQQSDVSISAGNRPNQMLQTTDVGHFSSGTDALQRERGVRPEFPHEPRHVNNESVWSGRVTTAISPARPGGGEAQCDPQYGRTIDDGRQSVGSSHFPIVAGRTERISESDVDGYPGFSSRQLGANFDDRHEGQVKSTMEGFPDHSTAGSVITRRGQIDRHAEASTDGRDCDNCGLKVERSRCEERSDRKRQPSDDDGGDSDDDGSGRKRHQDDRRRRPRGSDRRGDGYPSDSDDLLTGKRRKSSDRSKRWMKPEKFDGRSSFEFFMCTFTNCARYNRWKEEDKAAYLRWSLTSTAAQLLWDADGLSYDELVDTLKARFGNKGMEERFQTELRCRRRQKNESLRGLAQDIRRLMALAYPGEKSNLAEHLARDAFLSALSDPEFELRIREKNPADLDTAVKYAQRYKISKDMGGYSLLGVRQVSDVRLSYAIRATSKVIHETWRTYDRRTPGVNMVVNLRCLRTCRTTCRS